MPVPHLSRRTFRLSMSVALAGLVALGAFPARSADPTGLTGMVFDANGLAMGPYYTGFPGNVGYVLVQVGDLPVLVAMRRSGKRDDPSGMNPTGGGGNLYFKGHDCGGEPGAMDAGGPPGAARVAISRVPSHDVVIYLEDAGGGKSEAFNSYRAADSGHCYANVFTRVKNIGTTVNLSTLFTPPYHVR
jgi:hypothetical protein